MGWDGGGYMYIYVNMYGYVYMSACRYNYDDKRDVVCSVVMQ